MSPWLDTECLTVHREEIHIQETTVCVTSGSGRFVIRVSIPDDLLVPRTRIKIGSNICNCWHTMWFYWFSHLTHRFLKNETGEQIWVAASGVDTGTYFCWCLNYQVVDCISSSAQYMGGWGGGGVGDNWMCKHVFVGWLERDKGAHMAWTVGDGTQNSHMTWQIKIKVGGRQRGFAC